jgi:hypothetical protein
VATLAGVVATLLALLMTGLRASSLDVAMSSRDDGHIFTTTYDPPADRIESLIDVSDGQVWATLASDPTFSHPEAFKEGVNEFVYRAQRPLFPELLWVLSAGRPGLVPASLVLLTDVGVGLLAFGAVLLADQSGRRRAWGAAAAAMPGSMLITVILGPEALAAALGVLGAYWWFGPPRRAWLAVAFFVAAALMRDTMVLVPCTIAVYELVRRRRSLVGVAPLALPLLGYLGWIGSIRLRWGHWPTDPTAVSRVAAPFVGWYHALAAPEATRTAAFVLGAVLLVLAIRRSPGSPLTWIALSFALSTVFYGAEVLDTESYRPLLGMYVFALLAALPEDRTTGREPDPWPPPTREARGVPAAVTVSAT